MTEWSTNPKIIRAITKSKNELVLLELITEEIRGSLQADMILEGKRPSDIDSVQVSIEKTASSQENALPFYTIEFSTFKLGEKLRSLHKKDQWVGTFKPEGNGESNSRYTARNLDDLLKSVNNILSEDNKLEIDKLLGPDLP